MKLLIILSFITLTATKNPDIDSIASEAKTNLQKRESAYLYPRPRITFSRIKNKKTRPFATYGPPNSQKFQNNRPSPQFQAPDASKIAEFTKPSPIASQNEEPFRSAANYLPPKNQKLPTRPPIYFKPQPQAQKFQNFAQISDAAQFLKQNAPAISQLYQTPAENQNFEPQNPEITSRSHESLPSYASGTLEPYQSLQQIQNLEKDKIIAELRHQLAVQTQNMEPIYGPPAIDQNQNSGTSTGFPFPNSQYPLIGTNFGTFFGNDSPTQFALPIPSLGNNNKLPDNSKPSFPSLHPVSGHHHPVTPVTVHPLQPLHPHLHPHPVQPVLGVNTLPVSPVILKPVKPVFPVYYPSVPYVIQKPSVPVPNYSVIKSAEIW